VTLVDKIFYYGQNIIITNNILIPFFMESSEPPQSKLLIAQAQRFGVDRLLTETSSGAESLRRDVRLVLDGALSVLKELYRGSRGAGQLDRLHFAVVEAVQLAEMSEMQNGDDLVDETLSILKLAAWNEGLGEDLSAIKTLRESESIIARATEFLFLSH
jgi:hypothetical protein